MLKHFGLFCAAGFLLSGAAASAATLTIPITGGSISIANSGPAGPLGPFIPTFDLTTIVGTVKGTTPTYSDMHRWADSSIPGAVSVDTSLVFGMGDPSIPAGTSFTITVPNTVQITFGGFCCDAVNGGLTAGPINLLPNVATVFRVPFAGSLHMLDYDHTFDQFGGITSTTLLNEYIFPGIGTATINFNGSRITSATYAFTVDPTAATPEPSTWLFCSLGFGFVGIAAVLRRRTVTAGIGSR